MKRSSARSLMVVVVAAVWTLAGCVRGSGHAATSYKIESQRIEQLVATYRFQLNDRDAVRAAHDLREHGDRLYRAGNYRAAHRQYREAYPYLPEAYSYVMASDATLRSILEANAPNTADPAACVRAMQFSKDLATELSQVYSTGLAVARSTNDTRFMSSSIYARARATESCLQELAIDYEAQGDRCVGVGGLKACLGDPLL